MWGIVGLFVGAIAAWLLVDHLLSWRNERLRRGPAAWSQFGSERVFHSTGWEETQPPTEAVPSRGPECARAHGHSVIAR